MAKKIQFLLLIILLLSISIENYSQPQRLLSSSEIQLALKKLNVLGSVLYIAAHPDDENTAFLSYFASEKLTRTAYLSLTRGDGGQNLIGSEQAELLGIIRTQELIEARKIDGAEQFFTRAIDFGYSKTAAESFSIWNKDEVLSDVVWVIRKFKPDVIVTRFPATGGGHGQHTASAILALEAFDIANDPAAYPEQLKYVTPWQPKRLYWNGWIPVLEGREEEVEKFLAIDLGKFNPLIGKSYTEVSAESRSMHKSQGFGASGRRGEVLNYFKYEKGDSAAAELLENINISWSRVEGGKSVEKYLNIAEENFDSEKPSLIIPNLLQAYKEMNNLKDEHWRKIKQKEILRVIQSAAGIWIEAIANDYSATPGSSFQIIAGIVNRSSQNFTLKKVEVRFSQSENEKENELKYGIFLTSNHQINLPKNVDFSQPYWLKDEPGKGLFNIQDQTLIGLPETEPHLYADFILESEGIEFTLRVPVLYRWTDPVDGEKYRSFEIVPNVTAKFDDNLFLFPDSKEKIVNISLRSHDDKQEGLIEFDTPDGWKFEPNNFSFRLEKKNDEISFNLKITPPSFSSNAKLSSRIKMNGQTISRSMISINYPHIIAQSVFPNAEIKLVKLDLKKTVHNIGYIMGSGDEIPKYLEQLGYNVVELSDQAIENGDLSFYDAIITGIRAYNTRPRLAQLQTKILDYVHGGGALIVQYNVNQRLHSENIGPFSFSISRDRVAEEDSPIKFLKPDHPVLNFPNKISEKDFDGWIQERGLYFADSWDEQFETIIASKDEGESFKEGGLLFAKYGKGIFIYTGYSWFRQLPAGIPGAYRFFVNLLSTGNKKDDRTGHSSN
jgi:LmbE family N-acetylglucosaminyl deacetylase